MYNKKKVQTGLARTFVVQPMASVGSVATLLFVAAMTAGISPVQAQGNIVDVKVTFAGTCPETVDKMEVDVTKTPPQRVRWTAYDAQGAPLTTVSYDIFFDPFVGPSLVDSNKDGVITSKPVSSKAPATAAGVQYKYTIMAEGCTPLDPFIRVR